MKFKEFFRSGPAGIAAGVATVMLGGGAVAALAFSSPEPASRPMGDSRLSVGSQSFDAAIVANAGANNVNGARSVAGRDMADGSPVARGVAASRASSGAAAAAAGDGSSAAPSRGASSTTAPAVPGSAEYYRALLRAGSGGGGSLAMLPPGAVGRMSPGGRLAGNLTGANATDYTRDRAVSAVGDPLVPSRAFSSYGTNDAGSSAGASSSARKPGNTSPAIGTSPVGPASKPASSSSSSSAGANVSPVTSAPAPVIPPTPPARNSNSGSSASSAPGMVSAGTPAPATQPLGQNSVPGSVGNAVNLPDVRTAPAQSGDTPGDPKPSGKTPSVPAVGSLVGPDVILTPEPGTWVMVGSGLLLLGVMGRRRVSRSA